MSLDKPQQRHDSGDKSANSPQEQREGGLFSHVMDNVNFAALNSWNSVVNAPEAHKAEHTENKNEIKATDVWATLQATQKNNHMLNEGQASQREREIASGGLNFNDDIYASVTKSAAAKADQRFDDILKRAA